MLVLAAAISTPGGVAWQSSHSISKLAIVASCGFISPSFPRFDTLVEKRCCVIVATYSKVIAPLLNSLRNALGFSLNAFVSERSALISITTAGKVISTKPFEVCGSTNRGGNPPVPGFTGIGFRASPGIGVGVGVEVSRGIGVGVEVITGVVVGVGVGVDVGAAPHYFIAPSCEPSNIISTLPAELLHPGDPTTSIDFLFP